jgi:hypothetical protein
VITCAHRTRRSTWPASGCTGVRHQ